jgi:hypothetical protein
VDADDVPGVVGWPLPVGGIGGVQFRVGGGDSDPGIGEVAVVEGGEGVGIKVVVGGEGVGTVVVGDGERVGGQCPLGLSLCPNKSWWSAADTAGRREEPGGIWSLQCLLFSLAPAP